ncbi:hypothetical protein NCCP2331_01380 [Sporosarcina sp. NCCP-2331]|nr:hypothetical protein NCCP2331_01380 [Sporosarcina sp. NCCP-2331]GLB54766.1 hypothetical protein NCCP2378_05510 [Sporosarcina sp. NCCP-2378]
MDYADYEIMQGHTAKVFAARPVAHRRESVIIHARKKFSD